jgi:hypothetical protein
VSNEPLRDIWEIVTTATTEPIKRKRVTQAIIAAVEGPRRFRTDRAGSTISGVK